MKTQTEARNLDLPNLVEMLKEQSDVRYDVVVPSSGMKMVGGNLIVKSGGVRINEQGVHTEDATLIPTPIFDEGISNRLNIPMRYVRTMRNQIASDIAEAPAHIAPTLYDENVNYWLDNDPSALHLVRGFRTDDIDDFGIARAFLSDRYRTIDNYDVLLATLDGVKSAGVEVNIDGADVSDRRMSLRLTCPEVQQYSEEILRGYTSPFTGESGSDNPTIFAGLVIKNSETGGGAFSIVPRLVIKVCNNGLQMTKDAMRAVHLGSKLEEGVITWSEETQQQELSLITTKTRDAVKTFLDVEYMKSKIDELHQLAGVEVKQPPKTMKMISKKSGWSENEEQDILKHFYQGGDNSALGVAQAITSYAQTVKKADRQDELESSALNSAELVNINI